MNDRRGAYHRPQWNKAPPALPRWHRENKSALWRVVSHWVSAWTKWSFIRVKYNTNTLCYLFVCLCFRYPDSWYHDITSNKKFFSLAATYRGGIVGMIVAEIKSRTKVHKEVWLAYAFWENYIMRKTQVWEKNNNFYNIIVLWWNTFYALLGTSLFMVFYNMNNKCLDEKNITLTIKNSSSGALM